MPSPDLSPDALDILGLQFFVSLLVIIGLLAFIEWAIHEYSKPRVKRGPYTDARNSIDAWRKQQADRRREVTR